MANQSGQVYGLTILSPIIEDERLDICHAMELRWYLANLERDRRSPFAKVQKDLYASLQKRFRRHEDFRINALPGIELRVFIVAP